MAFAQMTHRESLRDIHSFEKIELFRAFQEVDTENPSPQSNNQLNLFDS